MEQRTEDAATLIVLLEKLLRETALFCGEVQQFLVVVFGTKVQCQHTGYVVAATTQLASHTNDDMFVVVHYLLTLYFLTLNFRIYHHNIGIVMANEPKSLAHMEYHTPSSPHSKGKM